MTYAETRSMRSELAAGSTDGKYKRVSRDRGGSIEATTWSARDDLSPNIYGITEAPVKEDTDGRQVLRDPYFHPGVPVGPAEI